MRMSSVRETAEPLVNKESAERGMRFRTCATAEEAGGAVLKLCAGCVRNAALIGGKRRPGRGTHMLLPQERWLQQRL